MVIQKGYSDYTFNCTANVPFSLEASGDAFEVFYATGIIQIAFDDNRYFYAEQTVGHEVREYQKVTVLSPINQTVTLKLGSGQFTDNRLALTIGSLSVSLTPSTTLTSAADVSVPSTTALQILASSTNRRKAKIMVPSTAAGPVRIGGAATDATHGVEYQPGTGDDFDTTAAIYAYNPNGVAVALQIAYMGV